MPSPGLEPRPFDKNIYPKLKLMSSFSKESLFYCISLHDPNQKTETFGKKTLRLFQLADFTSSGFY